jgi:hypothetical protein
MLRLARRSPSCFRALLTLSVAASCSAPQADFQGTPSASSAPAASLTGQAATSSPQASTAPPAVSTNPMPTPSAPATSSPIPSSSVTAATSTDPVPSMTPSVSASGTAEPPPPTLGEIDRGGGKYVLEFGDIYFEVDEKGGRITSFSLADKEVLLPAGVASNDIVYGSTFALSPQNPSGATKGSCWPPPAPVDIDDYTFSAGTGAQIVLTSPTAKVGFATCPSGDPLPDTGSDSLVITKTFTPLLDQASIQVDYTIKNTGTTDVAWAPWQVSRVDVGGLTFFPTGAGATVQNQLELTKAGGWSWWLYDGSQVSGTGDEQYGAKQIEDGAGGWLAHATTDGVLFLTTFTDTPAAQFAPGDGEIAIYAAPDPKNYVEIEPQGAHTTIPMGMSATWTVTWSLHMLPAGADLVAGDPELVTFVEGLVP